MMSTLLRSILLISTSVVASCQPIIRQDNLENPRLFSSYTNNGYYKIDSGTILTSVNNGEQAIFSPLLVAPDSIEPPSGKSISWSQSDYLQVASSLGEFVWNDSMDLQKWQIYYASFEKSCEDGSHGYQFGRLIYFREKELDGHLSYNARIVEIDPYYEWVRWGDAYFPIPLFRKWKNFSLLNDWISAEDALQIAEDNGGRDSRLEANNKCLIYVNSSNQNSWEIDYIGADFHVLVNRITASIN